MICHCCSNLPLDIFLPLSANDAPFKHGKKWNTSFVFKEGNSAMQELAESSAQGCQLCSLVKTTLDRAEPRSTIQKSVARGHIMHEESLRKIVFRCYKEGEVVITDGQRTGSLYWQLPKLGYGRKQGVVNDKANCAENFRLAKSWIKACSSDHQACRPDIQQQYLPTRLIHIEAGTENLLRANLVEAENSGLVASETKYVALSHCWGPNMGELVPKTTTDNLVSNLTGLDVESFPKTFKDAVQACHGLGYEYIWIDSLCIVQDDKNDFDEECSRMHEIYSGAYCAIVADDSIDPTGGCFLKRSPQMTKPCKMRLASLHRPNIHSSDVDLMSGCPSDEPLSAEVTIYPNFGPWMKSLQKGPVFSRGWCLQERELCNRVLHFTAERLLWECRQCTASEDEPKFKSKTENANLAPHLSTFRVLDDKSLYTTSSTNTGVKKRRSKWEAVVEAYSERNLSVKQDKLPAVSGIAAIIGNWQNDEYLAGIWRRDLLKGLSWFPKRPWEKVALNSVEWPPAPIDEGLPTWSWAAYDGPIAFCGETWFSGSWTTIIDQEGNAKWMKNGPDISIEAAWTTKAGSNKYGRVSSGEIELVGWTTEFTMSENDSGGMDEGYESGNQRMENKSHFHCKTYCPATRVNGLSVYFDREVERLPETQIVCLQFGNGRSVSGKMKCDVGIVLQKCGNGDIYRRLGMFDVSEEGQASWRAIRERKRVTLV